VKFISIWGLKQEKEKRGLQKWNGHSEYSLAGAGGNLAKERMRGDS